MVYLDYAANTPVCEEALAAFCETAQAYIANPNSSHELGSKAKERLDASTRAIAGMLDVKESEIVYTSGASESNNLAIIGAARQNKKYGRHIVTTYLEHSSVSGAVVALQHEGYEVDFADIGPDGLVDLEQLNELVRDDTILVSICAVDSEVGLRQRLDGICGIAHRSPHGLLHVDATQAIGKAEISFAGVDLATFAPHKFYGLNGVGVLIRKEPVQLEPLIHGGVSTTPYRSGTPALALIASTETALSLAIAHRQERADYVGGLNKTLRKELGRFPGVKINSTANSVPFILNISMPGIKTEAFAHELDLLGFCLSTKSACCAPNTVSRPVYALTKDKRAALSTLRISLSHLTAAEDIASFLEAFGTCYRKLAK